MPTLAGQKDLGRALRVRRDRRLTPAGVAVAAQAETVVRVHCLRAIARLGRFGGERRISTTAGSTHAFWPGQTGTSQRKQGGNVSGASMHSNVSSP